MPPEPKYIALDTCILIDAAKDDDLLRDLKHLHAEGHVLMAPLTVLGEALYESAIDGRAEVNAVVKVCRAVAIKQIAPLEKLRMCCQCIDDYLDDRGIYGASTSDRTHLAYAIMTGADYFVTSSGEVRSLGTPCGKGVHITCIEPPPQVVPFSKIKRDLLRR